MKPYGALHSKRVCRFESRADLVDALLASCHLPLMSDGSLTTRFRGRRVIDGGEYEGRGRAARQSPHSAKVGRIEYMKASWS